MFSSTYFLDLWPIRDQFERIVKQTMGLKMTDRLIPGPGVRGICGVTDMTLWRWRRDPKMNFPQPVKIGNRNYWRESELTAWMENL